MMLSCGSGNVINVRIELLKKGTVTKIYFLFSSPQLLSKRSLRSSFFLKQISSTQIIFNKKKSSPRPQLIVHIRVGFYHQTHKTHSLTNEDTFIYPLHNSSLHSFIIHHHYFKTPITNKSLKYL